jgi:hypothetical protein
MRKYHLCLKEVERWRFSLASFIVFWEFWNLRLVKIGISWSIEFCVVAGMVH